MPSFAYYLRSEIQEIFTRGALKAEKNFYWFYDDHGHNVRNRETREIRPNFRIKYETTKCSLGFETLRKLYAHHFPLFSIVLGITHQGY